LRKKSSPPVRTPKGAKNEGGSAENGGADTAKLGIDYRKHAAQFHHNEPVWNALLKTDFTRSKNTIATRTGLVAYGLAFAGRHMPASSIDVAEDWSPMHSLVILKVGYAINVVAQADAFFQGRTRVLDAPPSIITLTEQRRWLKGEACRYLMWLSEAIMRASPSALWQKSSPERRRNAHHIFFLSRDCHLKCPALIEYHSDDLSGRRYAHHCECPALLESLPPYKPISTASYIMQYVYSNHTKNPCYTNSSIATSETARQSCYFFRITNNISMRREDGISDPKQRKTRHDTERLHWF
jgi:hypothetical protein